MAILTYDARVGRLWRMWLEWKFRLFQQHRHRRFTLETVDGVPIMVLPDVFNPKLFHTGEALARYVSGVEVQRDTRVLDMGTGSGICGVFAARQGAHVVAVDIAEQAVRCAKVNALLSAVEDRLEILRGDLFEPVRGELFDLVLFNPPYFAGRPAEPWELAWRSEDVIERFLAGLRQVLAPGGRALMIVSTETAGIDEALRRNGVQARTVWKRNLISEQLTILELSIADRPECSA